MEHLFIYALYLLVGFSGISLKLNCNVPWVLHIVLDAEQQRIYFGLRDVAQSEIVENATKRRIIREKKEFCLFVKITHVTVRGLHLQITHSLVIEVNYGSMSHVVVMF